MNEVVAESESTEATQCACGAKTEEEEKERELFSLESFINAADLRRSPAGDKIYRSIMKARISMSAKRALMGVARNFNGTDLLLSNLTKSSAPNSMYQSNDNYGFKIKLELAFLKATSAMNKFDTMSADVFNIKSNIADLAFLHTTRAQGAERERMQNGKMVREDTVTQRNEIVPSPEPIRTQGKKFWQRG